MKAKFLAKINVLLGVLVAFFAGCHSQARVQRNPGPVAKYGVPQEILDQWEKERLEQQQKDSLQQPTDTIAPQEVQAVEEEEQRPDRNAKKYGPMPPRN